MKFTSNFYINFKKLKYRFGKALYLIIPIMTLVALSFVVSSQVENVRVAMDKSIFNELEEESTILQLKYPAEITQFSGSKMGITSENEYTELDLAIIEDIENVTEVTLNYDLPIAQVSTDNLFEDTNISLRNINALSENMASMYTSEDFMYTEGEPIPIILNSSQFIEVYEDWDGQTEMTVNFRALRESGADMTQVTPIKSKAIEYNKDIIIGSDILITFGGFAELPTFDLEKEFGVMTLVKRSEEDLAEVEATRKSTIDTYWDYDALSEGTTYEFVVVGLIESTTDTSIYIPAEFAQKVVIDNIQLQKDSLLEDVPVDYLDTVFTGMTYDGTELSSQAASFGSNSVAMPFRPGGGGGTSEESTYTESYEIPGLVIEMDEEDGTTVIGIYEDTSVFEDSIQTGNTISIKIATVFDRTQVVEDLNTAGYAYQDLNDLEVFESIQDTLDSISNWVTWSFIILTITVIMFTMSKFVSESTKEIGIFRAIGFTKGNILSIFLTQALLYTVVGYTLGIALGYLLNTVSAGFIGGWFETFATQTVAETVYVVSEIDLSIFRNIDWNSIKNLSYILAVIALVVSLFPANKAANISPVEAIKSE